MLITFSYEMKISRLYRCHFVTDNKQALTSYTDSMQQILGSEHICLAKIITIFK